MLIGGKATLWGPVLGAFLIEYLNELANNNFGGGNVRLFLFGGLLIAVVIFLPRGILPGRRVGAELAAYVGQGRPGRRPDRHRRQPGLDHRPGPAGRAAATTRRRCSRCAT